MSILLSWLLTYFNKYFAFKIALILHINVYKKRFLNWFFKYIKATSSLNYLKSLSKVSSRSNKSIQESEA